MQIRPRIVKSTHRRHAMLTEVLQLCLTKAEDPMSQVEVKQLRSVKERNTA
jgi:hypothetical protein